MLKTVITLMLFVLFCARTGSDAATPIADAEVVRLLEQVKQSDDKHSFSGVVYFEEKSNGHLDTSRWRINVSPSQMVMLQPLARNKEGEMTKPLFRQADTSWFPEGVNRWHFGKVYHHMWPKWHRADLQDNLDLLTANYDLHIQKSANYLGRDVQKLIVKPRFSNRPEAYFLIDKESKLILATHISTPLESGGVHIFERKFESFLLSPIEITAPANYQPKREKKPESFNSIAEFLSNYRDEVLLLEKLPIGFQLDLIRILQHKEKRIAHFMYTDGLALISLFQDKSEKSRKKANRKERHNPLFRVVDGEISGLHYGIIGEIPKAELLPLQDHLIPLGRESDSRMYWILGLIIGLSVLNILFIGWFIRYKRM